MIIITSMLSPHVTSYAYLRRYPLFASLKDDVIKSFSDYAQLRFDKKSTLLFAPEEKNDKFYIILSGWVKLFRQTMGGEEAIVDILTTDHSFGEIGLAGAEPMPYGAEVVEPAQTVSLPRFLLAEEAMRNSLFAMALLQLSTRQKMAKDMEIEHRTVQNAPQRIGCFLLKLCKDKTQGAVTLHLPYDKTVLAHRLGMQPETFSRALSRLKDEANIVVKGASFDIQDVRALADYTCSACSASFPCKDH